MGGACDFSTPSSDINDRNAEYFIQASKHFGNGLVAFELKVTNLIEDQRLADVSFEVAKPQTHFDLVSSSVADTISYNETQDVIVVVKSQDAYPIAVALCSIFRLNNN